MSPNDYCISRCDFRSLICQAARSLELGQNTLDVEVQNHIQEDRDDQQGQCNQSIHIDFVADALQIFEQFLLFQGIAVCGFTDHLQLILNALE